MTKSKSNRFRFLIMQTSSDTGMKSKHDECIGVMDNCKALQNELRKLNHGITCGIAYVKFERVPV